MDLEAGGNQPARRDPDETVRHQAGPSQPTAERSGFFGSLMDTRFNNLITPSMVRFLYVLMMIAIAIGLVVAIIAGFADSSGSGVAALIIGPLVALIYLIFARMYLELIIVAFKIREAAEQIAENTGGRNYK